MKIVIWCAALAFASGCFGTARGADAYRADTEKLLSTRSAQLDRCYDTALAADPKLAGTVTVQFVVERTSGTVTHATVDSTKSTAPRVLDDCVLHAVEGLELQPADRDEGKATFVYEFKATPAAS